MAAFTNDENKGCGVNGLDLNSGWNWTPTNHGWFFNSIISGNDPSGDKAEKSGGQREFVEYLARAAIAVGVAAIFIETHPDPENAPSDGPNMVPLSKMPNLLKQLVQIDKLIKNVKN